jgi:hypothetical protein
MAEMKVYCAFEKDYPTLFTVPLEIDFEFVHRAFANTRTMLKKSRSWNSAPLCN